SWGFLGVFIRPLAGALRGVLNENSANRNRARRPRRRHWLFPALLTKLSPAGAHSRRTHPPGDNTLAQTTRKWLAAALLGLLAIPAAFAGNPPREVFGWI